MWRLINNELRVMIDPLLFAYGSRIEEKVRLIDTLPDYMGKIEPNLCSVVFYYPKYTENSIGSRRSFFPTDKIINITEPPSSTITSLKLPQEVSEIDVTLQKFTQIFNETLSLAIENKCLYIVSSLDISKEVKDELLQNHGIQILKYEELTMKIEIFLQGFYNYFKFSSPIYGIDSPNTAHQMTDAFISSNLSPFEAKIHENKATDECKERVRSFNHNRYPDLLVARDQVLFFKVQQQLDAIRSKNFNNVDPRFHSSIIYHLNFYYYLLYGAIDHLAWITNDVLSLGYDLNSGRTAVGFKITENKNRLNFLNKINEVDQGFHAYITSDSFQEWLFVLGEVRNQAAHREIFTAGPLVSNTPESLQTDSEIDAIIYANEPPIPSEILHMFPEGFEDHKRSQDRYAYRRSKMKVEVDHLAVIQKNGEQYIFHPLERMQVDMKQLNEVIVQIINAYYRKISTKSD